MRLRETFVTITTCLLLFFSLNITYARMYFYDIFGHWAEDSIMWGANTVKLLNGYEDGSFNPDGDISRAEYVSLLYRTAKKQGIINDQQLENGALNYLDIDSGFWAYDHISRVKSFIDNKNSHVKFQDIFSGDNFLPNEKITREEATVLTYFFTTLPIDLKDISFNDIDDNYRYYNQITSMARNEIIFGNPDGTFKPENNITRAESVTIIQRLYKDMEYQKKSYIRDITLVESSNVATEYPLFGDYIGRKLDAKDLLYKRAIETLEYESLVGIIPFEEQHLYDSDPIKTIEELKKNKYDNVIGINYYLIKYESKAYNNQSQLIDEIFISYANGATVTDDELQIIFKKFSDLIENTDIMLKALERWESTSLSEVVSNNALFMKSKIHMAEGNASEAIKLYDNINSSNADIRIVQLMNQSHVLINLEKYDDAEKNLREGWKQIKGLDAYKFNSRKYDEQFIGALKEVLSSKRN